MSPVWAWRAGVLLAAVVGQCEPSARAHALQPSLVDRGLQAHVPIPRTTGAVEELLHKDTHLCRGVACVRISVPFFAPNECVYLLSPFQVQDILSPRYEWMWRLDDDSEILDQIG